MIKQLLFFSFFLKHEKPDCLGVGSTLLHDSQVCDVVDHGPAFDRKALIGDVVVINLQSTERSVNNANTDL